MAQKLSGGCTCGAIRYECDADPVIMLNCHCRDCQRANGSAYAAVLAVPQATLLLHGELRYHRVIAASGKAIERGFCANCGSQVMVKLEALPDMIELHAGSLDDPSIYRPAIMCARACPAAM